MDRRFTTNRGVKSRTRTVFRYIVVDNADAYIYYRTDDYGRAVARARKLNATKFSSKAEVIDLVPPAPRMEKAGIQRQSAILSGALLEGKAR